MTAPEPRPFGPVEAASSDVYAGQPGTAPPAFSLRPDGLRAAAALTRQRPLARDVPISAEQAAALYGADLEAALDRKTYKMSTRRAYRAMLRAVERYGGAALEASNGRVMVWSDLHLGHAKIMACAQRPFDDVDAMGECLWRNCESAVCPNDVLVCVGDVAMSPALNEVTWTRLRTAPGARKVLVIGNHDLTGKGELRVKGFDEVHAVLVSGQNPPLIWTHYPLIDVPAGAVNVHGHTHGTPPGRTRHINVSVEQLDYAPISLARLRRLAQVLVSGEFPAGTTTLERVRNTERPSGSARNRA